MNDTEWEPPTEWLVLYEVSGTCTYLDPCEMGHLDSAYTAFLESGRTRDQLLSLRMVEGEEYRVAVSQVRSFFLSTRQFRTRNAATLKYQREEDKEVRAELGLPYKEEDD